MSELKLTDHAIASLPSAMTTGDKIYVVRGSTDYRADFTDILTPSACTVTDYSPAEVVDGVETDFTFAGLVGIATPIFTLGGFGKLTIGYGVAGLHGQWTAGTGILSMNEAPELVGGLAPPLIGTKIMGGAKGDTGATGAAGAPGSGGGGAISMEQVLISTATGNHTYVCPAHMINTAATYQTLSVESSSAGIHTFSGLVSVTGAANLYPVFSYNNTDVQLIFPDLNHITASGYFQGIDSDAIRFSAPLLKSCTVAVSAMSPPFQSASAYFYNLTPAANTDEVLAMFAALDGTNGTTSWNGSLDVSSSCAAPSAAGLASKAIIVSRGGTVTHN